MLGETCGAPERSPTAGDLRLRGISHLTINVPDPTATNAFYQRIFGFDIQAYQAASPILGIGPGSDFLMFIGSGNGGARVNHACFYMDDFDVERVQGVLEDHGIRPREGGGTPPMAHWVSMRMPNRGGAPEGTPELYFSDPDGLSIQLQDITYCGGGGYLGSICQ
jgi:catechol 2,3-dioxygenase-like lactoylglutathione lyase family enzyme